MNSQHIREMTAAILEGDITLKPQHTTMLSMLLDTASDAYYNIGNENENYSWPIFDLETGEYLSDQSGPAPFEPILEDAEFDALERAFKELDPKNTYFLKVGSDVRGGKVPLPFKMGSLDQVYEGDTEKWIKANGLLDEYFVISDKLDGTSAAGIYDRKGVFNSAFSRGNGTMGADITRHIKHSATVPKKVAINGLQVRCEAIIPVAKWPKVKDETLSRSGREYKNARNYVAGKMNASETDQIFIDNLDIVVTSVESPELGKSEQFEQMRAQGFLVTPYIVVLGRDINDEFLTEHLTERRAKSEYEIDGIVVEVDDINARKRLPKTTSSLNPTYARKYKIAGADNLAQTKVVAVHWRVSKAGYLKPRVEIDPVDLAGVTITYATGFNAAFIRDNNIGPGAVIKITRAGDVIPYITEVVSGTTAQMPDEKVHGAMSYTEGDVDLVLDDLDASADARYYRILDAFKTLDVPFLRQGAVEKLIAEGFDTEAKIIKATDTELKKVLGDSAGKKVFDGLKAKLNPVELPTLAGASQTLGRGVGVRKSTKLLAALDGSFDNLPESPVAAARRIAEIEGFEQKTAVKIVNNLPKFKQFLADIDGYYTIAEREKPPEDGELKGLVVVFTGVRDKELEKAIEAKAGRIGSSVNKETTHLVCKDPSSKSGKMQKARDLGIPDDNIIDLTTAQERWS
jgi:DNA ligase (NAD+)